MSDSAKCKRDAEQDVPVALVVVVRGERTRFVVAVEVESKAEELAEEVPVLPKHDADYPRRKSC